MNMAHTLTNTQAMMNAQNIWSSLSESLKSHIPTGTYNTWIADINAVKVQLEEKTLILSVPNELTRGWIESNYIKIFKTELQKINPGLRNIKLTIARRTRRQTPVVSNVKSPNSRLELPTIDSSTNLNPDLTFENFIVSEYNRFAHTAALRVVESCGVQYNPLYFYGPTGVGKTHLLQAICNRVRHLNPQINVFYISSESYIEDYITAVRIDKVAEFRRRFQEYQVIAIDDAQFFSNKTGTLVELFHTFNALINRNAQILIASDRAPADLEGVEDRIQGRLSSGLILDLQDPSREDRYNICKTLAERLNLNLTPEVLNFIADQINGSIRDIQGALRNIHLGAANHSGMALELDEIKSLIQNRVRVNIATTPEEIIECVATHYKIQKNLLETTIRRQEVVQARQMAMYICREYLNMSFALIGRHFGNRDHTTVIHGHKKISEQIMDDPRIQKDLSVIRKSLNL